MAESESDIRITTDTTYFALTVELWGVYCEDFGENWPCYNSTALYHHYVCSHNAWLYRIMPVIYTVGHFVDASICINTLRPRQNGCHFKDDILLSENLHSLIPMHLNCILNGLIDNKLSLIQVMAWCRTGDKPLSESLMSKFTVSYIRHSASMIYQKTTH